MAVETYTTAAIQPVRLHFHRYFIALVSECSRKTPGFIYIAVRWQF